MRRDSIETALRRNDLCRVHRWADARTRGAPPPLELELEPLPGTPRSLRSVELSPGNRALRDPDAAPTEGCAREARADAVAGTTELAPLLWRAPPLPGARTLLARDLGPEENRAVLEAHPERTPWLLLGDGTLLPWTEAAARVWGVRDEG